jgi:hypothetical protein
MEGNQSGRGHRLAGVETHAVEGLLATVWGLLAAGAAGRSPAAAGPRGVPRRCPSRAVTRRRARLYPEASAGAVPRRSRRAGSRGSPADRARRLRGRAGRSARPRTPRAKGAKRRRARRRPRGPARANRRVRPGTAGARRAGRPGGTRTRRLTRSKGIVEPGAFMGAWRALSQIGPACDLRAPRTASRRNSVLSAEIDAAAEPAGSAPIAESSDGSPDPGRQRVDTQAGLLHDGGR